MWLFYVHQNTISEWTSIFQICALIYISTAVIFLIFGSVQIQSWNEPEAEKIKRENIASDLDVVKPILDKNLSMWGIESV